MYDLSMPSFERQGWRTVDHLPRIEQSPANLKGYSEMSADYQRGRADAAKGKYDPPKHSIFASQKETQKTEQRVHSLQIIRISACHDLAQVNADDTRVLNNFGFVPVPHELTACVGPSTATLKQLQQLDDASMRDH